MATNQRTTLTIQSWRPTTTVSGDDQNQRQNTAKEFQRLHAAIESLVNAAPQASDAAPLNPLNGLIRYATGAWATALGGEGLYVYKAGVWTHIV